MAGDGLRLLGALARFAALGWLLPIGADAARAQSCGLPDEVPDSPFDTDADAIGALFPLGVAECEKIAKDVRAACEEGSETFAFFYPNPF